MTVTPGTPTNLPSGVRLVLQGPSTPVPVGSTFTVNIEAQAAAQLVDGVEVHLGFDPALLEIIDADPGTPGVQVSPEANLDLILGNDANNATGHLDFVAGKLLAPFPSGTFPVATVTFRARAGSAVGSATVTFLSAPGHTTAVTFAGASVLGSTQGGTYTFASAATLEGQVSLQGRGAAGDPRWSVPLLVTFYQPGTTQIVQTASPTTNANGQFTVVGIPPGSYDVAVKHSQSLSRLAPNVALVAGQTSSADFGALLTGDVNDSNSINIIDFSTLRAGFGLGCNDVGFDPRPDLDANCVVSILDFSLLRVNFGQAGLPVVP